MNSRRRVNSEVRRTDITSNRRMNMGRKLILFGALFFVALVAGAAFAIWIDHNPTGMSAVFYAEKMQHAIRVFTVPLPTVVILATLFTIVSTILARREVPQFYLLIAASICIVAVALITAFGNVPINNQIRMWNVGSPPSNWETWRRNGGGSKQCELLPQL